MALSPINTDIDINFGKNKFTNDISLVKDVYSIRQSLINLVLTIPGEKPFNRNFGTSINDSLFENFSPVDSLRLEMELRDKIKLFETRVKVDKIVVNDFPINDDEPFVEGHPIDAAKEYASDINLLYVYISYIIRANNPGSVLRDSVTIGLTKVR